MMLQERKKLLQVVRKMLVLSYFPTAFLRVLCCRLIVCILSENNFNFFRLCFLFSFKYSLFFSLLFSRPQFSFCFPHPVLPGGSTTWDIGRCQHCECTKPNIRNTWRQHNEFIHPNIRNMWREHNEFIKPNIRNMWRQHNEFIKPNVRNSWCQHNEFIKPNIRNMWRANSVNLPNQILEKCGAPKL